MNYTSAPEIVNIEDKIVIGKSLTMSLSHNRTGELWKSFMPLLKKINNRINQNLYSVNLYSNSYFQNFNPSNTFTKWAATEIIGYIDMPEDLKLLVLPGGRYAVFTYKGLSTDPQVYHYIYNIWLPKSGFDLDYRPHFEILGDKYKNNDPDSEEQIWIPVKD